MPSISKPAFQLPARLEHDRHGHDHQHHGHAHSHEGHAVAAELITAARPRTLLPRFSLIALSGLQRLMLALPAIAVLWLLTLWAVTDG